MNSLYSLDRAVKATLTIACFVSSACSSNSPASADVPASTTASGGTTNVSSASVGNSGGASLASATTGLGGITNGGASTAFSTATGGQSNTTVTATAIGTGGTGGTAGTAGAGGSTLGRGLTLYYIRHAEVVANTLDPAEVTYENSETLTALGEKQIESLTSYLLALDVTPDAIVSSPMRRTQKTIEPYLVAKQLKGELWMTLAECCNTTPTGAELPTAPQYTPLKATVESGNFSFTVPTENRFWKTDTYEEGLYMVSTARSELLKRYSQSGKTVFVIGHASAGLVMIGLLGGSDMRQGTSSSGPNAVFLLNTGVMRLIQDPTTGMFKLDGRNINNPVTK